ncbi:hypothetical protein FACS1894178_0680 [Bacteroidia bacterium]|nr:hypothetical protein FACS1894178_0680 [Bacteroidia bacterium]
MKKLLFNTYIAKILCVVAFLLCVFSTTNAQTTVTINYQNNNGTYSIPSCYIQNVSAQLWSGGGGGGGAESVYGATAAGGGGGGAYANVAAFNPSGDLTIVVGYGGNGGFGNFGGSSGGESKIQAGSDYVQANGGGGGVSAYRNGGGLTASDGGSKGTVEGTLSYTPTLGTDGSKGAGGATAPSAGKGGNGGNGGAGGNGGSGSGGEISSNGSAGNLLSGGGGGAAAYDLFTINPSKKATGGTGAKGNVIVSFDFVIPDVTVDKNNIGLCQGGSDIVSINSSVCDNSTYQWYKNGYEMFNETSASLTVTEAGTYYVIVTLHISDLRAALNLPENATISENDVTSSKQSENIVVSVYPNPIIADKSFDVCSGYGFEVYFHSDFVPVGTTFTWNVSENEYLNASSETSAQSSIGQSLTNTSEALQHVDYVVTALTVHNCTTVFEVAVNVKPTPKQIQNFSVEPSSSSEAIISWDADEYAQVYVLQIFEEEIEILNEILTETSYTAQNLELDYKAYQFKIFSDYGCDTSASVSVVIDYPTQNARKFDMQNIHTWVINNDLHLQSTENQTVTLYSVIGIKIKEMRLISGKTEKLSLSKGVYILSNGKKAIKFAM